MEHLLRSVRPVPSRYKFCASCLEALRNTATPNVFYRVGLQNSDRIQRRFKGYIAPAGEQARPITGFYAEILKKQLSQAQPITPTEPVLSLPESPPKTQKQQAFEKASVIFGSKQALADRRKDIHEASKDVAGIRVPPRPEEPDNCCMSGCVNCVWDMYRDEMEEWAEQSAKARMAMQALREQGKGSGSMVAGQATPSHVAMSMDDDGGGSDTNWSANVDQDKLFDDIPVGIREFMRTEKKLKQMHKKDSAVA